MQIDTNFDFRSDSNGLDPDQFSPRLKLYHQYLWSKLLPNGKQAQLLDDSNSPYLSLHVDGKIFPVSSDSISNSYAKSRSKQIREVMATVPLETMNEFIKTGSSIGGFIIFPSNRVNGKMTINGSRGFNSSVADRFDLTLECIRRHYKNESSPLAETLTCYADFFEVFESFNGYIDFFYLQDLVDASGSIKYFIETYEPFLNSPYPTNVSEYMIYKLNSEKFVTARNKRLAKSTSGHYKKFS